jgi:alginate O-acetyltransferase complex protein AlgI
MLFSSLFVLFVFLPLALWGHLLLPERARNTWLLALSLVFYAWGEPSFVLVMLGSIAGNYALGFAVAPARSARTRKFGLTLALVANLGLLASFKYLALFGETLNALLATLGVMRFELPELALPIGISFFTFQALSYVIDVYRGQVAVQRSLRDFALYVALFPQLIAGPIVRYKELEWQLGQRRLRASSMAAGVRWFLYGLAKKVLIADTAARAAEAIFALPEEAIDFRLAWVGVLAYTIQIYFDFSGYSDMAVGIGRLLGFRFPQNFRHPYGSRTITEFWRRWHRTLSGWFRDYLYVPLGGNRGGPWKTTRNLWLVFLLCGLWHGASWSFVLWGAWHGLLLSLERTKIGLALLGRAPRPLLHVWTMLGVMLGWVLFNARDLAQALAFTRAMLGLAPTSPIHLAELVDGDAVAAIAIGALLALPVAPALGSRVTRWLRRGRRVQLRTGRASTRSAALVGALELAFLAALAWVSASFVAAQTSSPFLYFRF